MSPPPAAKITAVRTRPSSKCIPMSRTKAASLDAVEMFLISRAPPITPAPHPKYLVKDPIPSKGLSKFAITFHRTISKGKRHLTRSASLLKITISMSVGDGWVLTISAALPRRFQRSRIECYDVFRIFSGALALDGTQTMRLQVACPPDALH